MKPTMRLMSRVATGDALWEFKLNFGTLYRWHAPEIRQGFGPNNTSLAAQGRRELGFRLVRDIEETP